MIRFLKLLLVLPFAVAAADTIELKTGERVEGKILATDSGSVTIEVHFSPTIVDERTIARADIAHFAVEAGDEAAFEKIRDVKTPDTALSQKTCEAVINEKLLPFLKQFPSSPRAPDVQVQIRAIRADAARLRAGDVKIAGTWYDKSAFDMEKYQIEGATAFDAMNSQAAADNGIAAMNSFELLQRSYPNSMAYTDAVPLATRVLEKLEQQLSIAISNLPQIKAQRQEAIDRTPVEQQQPIKQALAAEDARAVAAAAVAQKNQQRFFQIFPFDEKGITAMQAAAQQIDQQLKLIDQKQLAQNAVLVRRANQELDENQFVGATTTLAELKAAWPTYEALPRMEQRIKSADDANKASAELAAKKKLEPKP